MIHYRNKTYNIYYNIIIYIIILYNIIIIIYYNIIYSTNSR